MKTTTKDIKFKVGDKVKWGKRKEEYCVYKNGKYGVHIFKGNEEVCTIVLASELTKVPKRAVKKEKKPVFIDLGDNIVEPIEDDVMDNAKNIRNWRPVKKYEWPNVYTLWVLVVLCLAVVAYGEGLSRAAGY